MVQVLVVVSIQFGFNTQPPEGGWGERSSSRAIQPVSTHSRPKAAGFSNCTPFGNSAFQHTAARRRLGSFRLLSEGIWGFNTQPPEGGWLIKDFCVSHV